ncbi:hypothetical protein [Streptomyces sp. NRRL B-24484]|uniref:hypothetical protein n=1 Tax=Streptomyces sp. NRRL B-24484 TaxID=1463833 RepID=UPI0004BEB86A|nr:hypothetical protein [Streptomyces sp. NRRL B-24484]
MPRAIAWPTREQWQADAERAERTSRRAADRVPSAPADWLPPAELAEARRLAAVVVRQARKALTAAGNAAHRPTLNEYGREAADADVTVSALTCAWRSILRIAEEQGELSTPETAQLHKVYEELTDSYYSGAQAAEDQAVRQAVEFRATEEAWQQELDRRARVERGPKVTTITVHADGTSTVSDPQPYRPPASHRRF